MQRSLPRAARSRPAAVLRHALLAALAAGVLASCGGDSTAPEPAPAPVATVTVGPEATTLTPGDTVRLVATLQDSAGTALTDRTIAWTSSDTTVATVSAEGLVTARTEGTATITATVEGQHDDAAITVNPTPVGSVVLALDSTALYIGDTLRFSGTALDARGDTLPGRVVSWTVSDTAVATVDATGLLTARAAGTATLTATSEGQRDSLIVTVTRAPVALVVVSSDSGFLIVGDTVRLVATVLDARGDTVTDSPVSWTSSNWTVATVDATGLVTAYTLDTVTIAAIAAGRADVASLRTVRRFPQLVPGNNFSCGLSPLGHAYCWGHNGNGALGDGTTTDHPLPAPVQTSLTFAQLDGGVSSTCGLAADGTAYCWGANVTGELGDGTTTERHVPTAVTGGLTFTQLAMGSEHVCGLTGSGAAYCWGLNGDSELGDGTTTNRSTPVPVTGGITFTQLTAGQSHTCGLAPDGTAYCWGDNFRGELGDGSNVDRPSPVLVTGGHTFTQIAAGYLNTCGLTTDGAAYCWGDNFRGELGDGSTTPSPTPVPVAGGHTFAQLVTTPFGPVTCGLDAQGAAYCWGDNLDGALGDGSTTASATPVAVSGGHVFATLSMGFYMTCGLTPDGLAYCWGHNDTGQLGDGTTTSRSTPVLVAGQQ